MVEDTRIRSVQELEQIIAQLERIDDTHQDAVLDAIGDQITVWEFWVRRTSSISLAIRIGELLEKHRRLWLALSWFSWACEAAKAAAEGDLIFKALRMKGRVHIKLGMYEESLTYLLQVEERLIQGGSPVKGDLPLLWQNIASVYAQLQEYELALEYAHRARIGFRQQADLHKTSVLELMAGTYLFRLDRYKESYEYLLSAREGLEQFQDYFLLARCWHNYGELMWDWGRWEEALASWRMSLEMKKKNHDYEGQVNTLLSIASYLGNQQDWHGALRYTTQAFAICHEQKLYDQEILCLDRWSNILFALGKYSDLEVCASRAMLLSKCVSTQSLVSSLFHKISDYCKQVGLCDFSEKYTRSAVQIMG